MVYNCSIATLDCLDSDHIDPLWFSVPIEYILVLFCSTPPFVGKVFLLDLGGKHLVGKFTTLRFAGTKSFLLDFQLRSLVSQPLP